MRFSALATVAGVALSSLATIASKTPADPLARECGVDRQQHVEIELLPPDGVDVSTVVIELGYDGKYVDLPGDRDDGSVKERFAGFPSGAIWAVNDGANQTRVVVAASRPLPVQASLFTVRFDACSSASLGEREFSCAVSSCVAMNQPADGCRCRAQLASGGQ